MTQLFDLAPILWRGKSWNILHPPRRKTTKGKEQRVFPQEFKLEAVHFAPSSGKPILHIARDLGIADSTLHPWCKQLTEQGEEAFPGSGHQTQVEEENRRLKGENELLKQERDIYKKAVGIFSRAQL